MYRLITLPLAGAADLEPCTVDGAVEVFMADMVKVCMCRYEKRKVWCRDKRRSPCAFRGRSD
jgi:hypothetical protein